MDITYTDLCKELAVVAKRHNMPAIELTKLIGLLEKAEDLRVLKEHWNVIGRHLLRNS